jgi:hypothetical protein
VRGWAQQGLMPLTISLIYIPQILRCCRADRPVYLVNLLQWQLC